VTVENSPVELAAEAIDRATRVRPAPRWVAPVFGVLALLTIPWIGYLAVTLPRQAVTAHYRGAWVGFDVGLVAALVLTAVQAYRGHRRVGLAATATATLLVVDAWFDVTTTPAGIDLVVSIVLALLVELPLAAVCLWIAWNGERITDRRMRQLAARAQLAAGRASTAERALSALRRGRRAGRATSSTPPGR
jgi:hypothetical protein